jgi:transcriptional regulator with XRE-family HTH domain
MTMKSPPPPLFNPAIVRQIRRLLELNQATVARAASISPSYYGQLERGDFRPTAEVADRISKALRELTNGAQP